MNKNKRLYLWGGIGNVLYQVNYALYLKNLGFKVEVSTILLKEVGLISKFNGHHKGTLAFFQKFNSHLVPPLSIESKISIRDIINFTLKFFSLDFFGFISFSHRVPDFQEISKARYIMGYFQLVPWRSNLLTSAMQDYIMTEHDDYLKEISLDNSTLVVHLRFGDKSYDSDYYLDISLIERLYERYKKVYFVSDSPEKVDMYISNLINSNSTFYNFCSDSVLKDFIILYRAKNIALSRSSFSWWAAELSLTRPRVYEPCPFYSHLNWSPFTINLNKICYEKC